MEENFLMTGRNTKTSFVDRRSVECNKDTWKETRKRITEGWMKEKEEEEEKGVVRIFWKKGRSWCKSRRRNRKRRKSEEEEEEEEEEDEGRIVCLPFARRVPIHYEKQKKQKRKEKDNKKIVPSRDSSPSETVMRERRVTEIPCLGGILKARRGSTLDEEEKEEEEGKKNKEKEDGTPREKVPTSGETICPGLRTMNTPLPGGTLLRFGIPETTAETSSPGQWAPSSILSTANTLQPCSPGPMGNHFSMLC
ncbi:hypothetical protein M0802_008748 [Mischocyttarus mexicanus]|nr:hypothetical protein M0802_008748 [Mischocyttarus mexicanus]